MDADTNIKEIKQYSQMMTEYCHYSLEGKNCNSHTTVTVKSLLQTSCSAE